MKVKEFLLAMTAVLLALAVFALVLVAGGNPFLAIMFFILAIIAVFAGAIVAFTPISWKRTKGAK